MNDRSFAVCKWVDGEVLATTMDWLNRTSNNQWFTVLEDNLTYQEAYAIEAVAKTIRGNK